MFVFALSSQSFAQNAPQPAPAKKQAAPKPGEASYKMTNTMVTSAQPKPADKPKPVVKITPKKPGTKAAYMKYGDIKGE